jgi:hypothetical protein
MAYSDFGPHRRSRRRRNVLVLVTLLAIIGVLVLAVRYRTERRQGIDYMATAQEVAAEHAEMADQLGTVLASLGEEERPAVLLRLESMATRSLGLRRQIEELEVTRPIAEVAGLMTVAVRSWDDGIGSVDDAIVAILDAEEGDRSGDDALRSAFELLSLGDRAYLGVLDGVVRLDPEIVPAEFPAVSYTKGEFAALYDAEIIADRLRASGGLTELRDITVVGATIPEPVSEGIGGIWTIPASDAFSAQVTVSNTGNVVAEKISVLVTLQKQASSDDVTALSQVIPAIEPGESVTIPFENLEVEPGQVYTITATVSFDDGPDETDDNTWDLVFERNAE